MRIWHLPAAAAVLAVMACASVGYAADVNTTGLRHAVKAENVFDNQADLEAIADSPGNNGTRDTRTPGYLDSVDYVVDQLKSYGYDPEITEFNLPEWVENSTPVLTRTDLDPDKSYRPGNGRRRREPRRRLHHLRALALRHAEQRAGRADQRCDDPEPRRHDQRL